MLVKLTPADCHDPHRNCCLCHQRSHWKKHARSKFFILFSFIRSVPLSHFTSLFPFDSLLVSCIHRHTISLSLSQHTHTHNISQTLAHTCTHTLSVSVCVSLNFSQKTHTYAQKHSQTHTNTHTHTHTQTHTHKHTHTHTLKFTDSLSLFPVFSYKIFFNADIVKIGSRTWSFCVRHYVQSYSAKETSTNPV